MVSFYLKLLRYFNFNLYFKLKFSTKKTHIALLHIGEVELLEVLLHMIHVLVQLVVGCLDTDLIGSSHLHAYDRTFKVELFLVLRQELVHLLGRSQDVAGQLTVEPGVGRPMQLREFLGDLRWQRKRKIFWLLYDRVDNWQIDYLEGEVV